MQPKLKQFGDLTEQDFVEHPVWVQCHTFDSDAPWVDETDEETFRPWLDALPISGESGLVLLATSFQFADGSKNKGFASLPDEKEQFPNALGTIQPTIFTASGEMIGFWLGMFPSREQINNAYKSLGKSPNQIFPIQFTMDTSLIQNEVEGVIPGFCSIPNGLDSPVKIEI